MATYLIRKPEDPKEEEILNTLLAFLDKKYGTVTYPVIAIVECQPEVDQLLSSLAEHVYYPIPSQEVDLIQDGFNYPIVSSMDDSLTTSQPAPAPVKKKRSGSGTHKPNETLQERVCTGCGKTYMPRRYDQKLCSKNCPGKRSVHRNSSSLDQEYRGGSVIKGVKIG